MTNTAVDALLKILSDTVASATNGSVVVNAHSYDGAHRLLIRDSPQALAREAIADAGNIATGVASEQGAGEATEADAAAGDAPSAPSLQTNLGKAQASVRLITKTIEMLVCNPNSGPANVPGLVTTERAAERAADAPTGPLLDAAAAAQAPPSQGTRSGGAGAFASSVHNLLGRHVRGQTMDMEGEIISINEGDRTLSVFFGGADFKRMTKEEAEASLLPPKQEASLSSWNDIEALYEQGGVLAPRDNGEYGHGDDDCELAEEPPPKQPKFQLPDIALDAESEGWREDIFKALPRHVLGKRGCGDIPMAATCDEGKNWEPPEARGAVFLSARMRGQLAYLERARIEAAAYIKQTVSLEEGVLMNLKPLSKMAKSDLTILCTARGLSLSLPSGKMATKEDLVTKLMACADLEASAQDSALQSLAALEAAYRKKAVWKPNESVATLRQWCSSAILRAKQREGHAAGLN